MRCCSSDKSEARWSKVLIIQRDWQTHSSRLVGGLARDELSPLRRAISEIPS